MIEALAAKPFDGWLQAAVAGQWQTVRAARVEPLAGAVVAWKPA